MSAPRVVAVAPGSPAARAGLAAGDEVLSPQRAGAPRRDRVAAAGRRGRPRARGAPGRARAARSRCPSATASRSASRSARRCSTRSAPATTTASSASSTSCRQGCGRSLYLKDDDYRLSFLYGNFTTLTRFTEADLERVVTEGLSPLNVSIHATDPEVRAGMLRNRRGATSLRWLRALLDHGIEVHGQVVVCPGLNDGAVLDDTLAGVLDQYPELASLCVVPLGVSRYNHEPRMRPHTARRGRRGGRRRRATGRTCSSAVLGRRLVFAADEYYLLAGRPFPRAGRLRGLPDARGRHRHGPHVRARVHRPRSTRPTGVPTGFFAWVDGAPAEGYRARGRQPAARARSRCSLRRHGSRRHPHRQLRRPGAAAAGRQPRPRRRAGGPGRQRVLRRQHRRHRPAWSAPTSPASWPTSPRATATCCPTCACPRAASSTAPRPTTCPGPSRSSPPTASRCARALEEAAMSVARRGHRRAAERGQVHARQPHRRAQVAIVEDKPGVTRDRKELEAEWLGVPVHARRHRRLAAGRRRRSTPR